MSYQREFESRLNVGVVGVGSHCYRNILPAMHYLPVRLKAFCDLRLDLAKATAEEYGVGACYASTADMYAGEDLDCVFICVSPEAHPESGVRGVGCRAACVDGEAARYACF